MSIHRYKTKTGRRYMVRYTTPSGKRTTKRGFTSKDAATAWEYKQISDILTGQWVDQAKGNLTLGDYGDNWIDQQTHLKPTSLSTLSKMFYNHVRPTFGETRLNDITPGAIKAWLNGLTNVKTGRSLAPNSKRQALKTLSQLLGAAVEDGLLASNPARHVTAPKRPKLEKTFLTVEQLHALAESAGDYELHVLTLGYSGIRFGEFRGMEVSDVNSVTRRLHIRRNITTINGVHHVGTPKNGESRTTTVPPFLFKQIEEHAAALGSGLLWPGRCGGYIARPSQETGWLAAASRRAGLPIITPHDLRHTAASIAIQSGASVKVVQRMLGHSSAAMTLDIYAGLFEDDLDGVAQRMEDNARALGVVRL